MKISPIAVSSFVLLAGLSLSSITVEAEEVGARNTEATFGVEAGGSDTGPFDPIKPIDPVVPPMKGELTLDAASKLNFGSIKLGEGSGTYNAIKEGNSVLGVQVTDSRGKGQGWNLQVKISDFTGKKANNILKGASVTIPKGTVETNSADITKMPEASEVKLTSNATSVFKAAPDTGMGTWVNLFEGKNEKVSLKVPDGNYVDTYTADITWSLLNAPK